MPLARRHPCQSGYEGSQKRLSAESEQLLAQSDDLFDVGGSLAGLVMRSAESSMRPRKPLLLKTAQPLAHCEDGGLKQTSGRA